MQVQWACWAAVHGERSASDHAYPVMFHRAHPIRGDEWTCGEHAKSHIPGEAGLRLVSVACCEESAEWVNGCADTPFVNEEKCSFEAWSAGEEKIARKSAYDGGTFWEDGVRLLRWVSTVDQARRERDQAREELEKLRAAVRLHRKRTYALLLRSDVPAEDDPDAVETVRALEAVWMLVP